MAKRGTQKRRPAGFPAGKGSTPKALELSRAPTFRRADLLILVGLAAITLGIYAQVIGHQFIAFDDNRYIEENVTALRAITKNSPLIAATIPVRPLYQRAILHALRHTERSD